MNDFSLRELMNLLRFRPDPTGDYAGPVIKPNAGSGLTTSLENLWKNSYEYTKLQIQNDIDEANKPSFFKQIPAMAWIDLGLKNLTGIADGLTPKYKADLLLGTAGVGTSSRYGINYQTQNAVDGSDALREGDADALSGLASLNFVKAGAWFLGGRNKQQELTNIANQLAFRTNMYGGDMTSTAGMLLDLAKKRGNQESLVLFTENGFDALRMPDEVHYHAETGSPEIVKGGIPGKDSNLAKVQPEDFIISKKSVAHPYAYIITKNVEKNKTPGTRKIAENVARRPLKELADIQKFEHLTKRIPQTEYAMASNGIDNWGNIIQTVAGIGTALGGYMNAKASEIHTPKIGVRNRFEIPALKGLAGLNVNPQSVIRQQREAEARGRAAIMASGGLKAGQKALANTALTSNTQNNIANYLAQVKDRGNALLSQYYTTALNAGNADVQYGQQANQYADTVVNQAGSNKNNNMFAYLALIPGMLGKYWENWYTQQMGKNMLALYLDSNDIERKKYGIV